MNLRGANDAAFEIWIGLELTQEVGHGLLYLSMNAEKLEIDPLTYFHLILLRHGVTREESSLQFVPIIENYCNLVQTVSRFQISSPFFSFISLICAGVGGFSSTLGVTISSSLPLFVAVALALGFAVFFLVDDSAAGVLGVVNLSLVAVLGVFAGLSLSVIA